ncbi:MAG: hypothetical protein FWD61_11185 [Phycisphaerales bacterium]|nr:hypothetical protein [Phycisphaerales bacterium]
MHAQALRALTRMADLGVSNADVNRIIAGGIIEGTPQQTIHALRNELELVNGKRVTVFTQSGGTMTFDTGDYAKLVAITKTREATVGVCWKPPRDGRRAKVRPTLRTSRSGRQAGQTPGQILASSIRIRDAD